MAFITNQWLKDSFTGRGHYPIPVKISSDKKGSSWNKKNNVVIELRFDKENLTNYKCEKCGVTTTQKGFTYNPPICSHCGKQTTLNERKDVEKYEEFQQVYLTQEDAGNIIKDLFLVSSIESSRDFLRDVIPGISDEFKFELIKLLLNDEKK
jgi:DNA-directed RNA polymerase subunit RPC12/RpoP